LLWEDQSVPVRNLELVDALLKVQEAQDRLSNQIASDSATGGHKITREKQPKKEVAAYGAILSALSDAKDVARKLVEVQQVSNVRPLAAIGCSSVVS